MHKFLKSIGFSDFKKKDLEIILNEIIARPQIVKVTKDSVLCSQPLKKLNELVKRPLAFLDDIVYIVDCHITVLINKHILVEEAGVHHVKKIGGYVAGGEIELVVYCCGGDERFRPPGLFKVKVLKFEKILHKTVHCERSSGHAVSCKDIVSAAA